MRLPITPGSYAPGSLGQAGLKKGPAKLPEVAAEKCNQCLACWIYCPDTAILVKARAVGVDSRVCKGCGICAVECSSGAIKMVEVS